ncbi:MAG: methionine--tRNA ligase [Opitutales bacterium]
MKRFYLTTAIDYPNGPPHLGHAYEKVLTDVIARFRRLMGDDVFFLTGLDEHGQKVVQTANSQGTTPGELVDRMAPLFRELCEALHISNDDFITTRQERHQAVVRQILSDLYERGEIYQAQYNGYYSVRQEQFVTEKEQVDGKWPDLYGEVVELSETNYFFRLSKYQDWLAEYLRSNAFIVPAFRQKQVLEFLKEPVNDLCISRPRERLDWGIPLPFDEGFVTYVWFDALLNYISGVGYGSDGFEAFWPCDYHVIGKDILVPAHSVYWPIMLKAAGVPLPKRLLVHGWWHLSGQKMSKSTGVTVDPVEMAGRFGADAFRYFMIREMSVGQDSNFSIELFLTRYTDDLGNDLGNLVSRLLNMGGRYCDGTLPPATLGEEPEKVVRDHWERTRGEVLGLFEGFQFHLALEKTFGFIREINRYAEKRQPWKLAKSSEPADRAALETSLAVMAEGTRLAVVLLQPVMPELCRKVLELLGQPMPTRWEGHLEWSTVLDGARLGQKTILFPRPEQAAES